mgnify:CR=1 FL=1
MTRQIVNINNIDIGILRQTIHERMPELRRRYGIKSLGIFGSYVHGCQTKRSDIDLLVEFDNQVTVTLIGFVALERELVSLLGRRVDLVERDTLKPAIGRRILAEVVPI